MVPAAAAQQGGPFRYAQALAAGCTRAEVSRLVAAGAWLVLFHGIYVEARLWDGLDDTGQYLLTCRARLLGLKPGWHVARRAAALVHHLPLLGVRPTVPLLVHHRDHPSDRGSSRHERVASLPLQDTTVIGGIPVTGLARTVVDVARAESFVSALVVADAALGQGLDAARLAEVVRRSAHWPGGLRVRRVAEFANGLAESPLESLSRSSLRALGLPEPELQVEVYLGSTLLGRVDKYWAQYNLVGEDDGRLKYTDPQVMYREKLRQEALEDAGLEVVRWSWAQAWRPHGDFEAKIRRGLERGRGRQLDPRLRFVRTTVDQSLARKRSLG